ncbi:MAG: hypothetical protein HPY55_13595 [Firmicutes bacterium]|nr:hypothetical protein [Bacillota bacterium]
MDEWARAAGLLAAQPGVAMLIGAPNSGKTTCATLLASVCADRGRPTALVDSDIGQSDIGPPGTIGLGLVTAPLRRMRDATLAAAYFVGSNSPAGHVHYMVVGARRMVDRARERGAEAVIVDTTGTVHGWFARELKQAKFDAVRPRYVIGLQASREIEHLLAPLERCGAATVLRLPVSPEVRLRSREERRMFRERAFREHLAPTVRNTLSFRSVPFLRTFLGCGRDLTEARLSGISSTLGVTALYAAAVPGGLFVVGQWDREPDALRLKDIALSESGAPGFVHLVRDESFRSLLVGLLDAAGEFLAEGIIESIDFEQRAATIVSCLDAERFSRVGSVVLGALKVAPDGRELGRISPSDV